MGQDSEGGQPENDPDPAHDPADTTEVVEDRSDAVDVTGHIGRASSDNERQSQPRQDMRRSGVSRDVFLTAFGAVLGVTGGLLVSLLILEPRTDAKSAESALAEEGLSSLRSYLEVCTQAAGVRFDDFEIAVEAYDDLVSGFREGADTEHVVSGLPPARLLAERACRPENQTTGESITDAGESGAEPGDDSERAVSDGAEGDRDSVLDDLATGRTDTAGPPGSAGAILSRRSCLPSAGISLCDIMSQSVSAGTGSAARRVED